MEEASNNHEAIENEDRISKLPKSLISNILSFLPTKDAVRTSVLSKRWINHWTSITKLDLDDSKFYFYSPKKRRKKSGGQKYFISFVNRVLLFTKSSTMESISLVIANKYDVSLLNTWITHACNQRVKILRIHLSFELPFSALTSRSLFKSYSFEELVLKMNSSAIRVPNNVYFRSLKLLKLCGINFTVDSSGYYFYMGLSFPVLNKFEAKNCTWLCAKDVTVNAPLLEKVFIEQDLESVSHEPRSCRMKFSASHLKEFTYCGYGISQPIVLSTPSSARNASAKIILNESQNSIQETGSCAFLLLKQFSQVKSIKYDGAKVLTQQNMAVLPVFTMLTYLELCSVTGEVLLGILQKSPVLKTLVTKEICKFNQGLLNSDVVPSCLESTLQVVRFEKVKGSEHELFLAKFFMENGVVLERVSFFAHYWMAKSKVMEEFKEKLFSYKKGFSSFAVVDFSCIC